MTWPEIMWYNFGAVCCIYTTVAGAYFIIPYRLVRAIKNPAHCRVFVKGLTALESAFQLCDDLLQAGLVGLGHAIGFRFAQAAQLGQLSSELLLGHRGFALLRGVFLLLVHALARKLGNNAARALAQRLGQCGHGLCRRGGGILFNHASGLLGGVVRSLGGGLGRHISISWKS